MWWRSVAVVELEVVAVVELEVVAVVEPRK
jgi:hypothetical protein